MFIIINYSTGIRYDDQNRGSTYGEDGLSGRSNSQQNISNRKSSNWDCPPNASASKETLQSNNRYNDRDISRSRDGGYDRFGYAGISNSSGPGQRGGRAADYPENVASSYAYSNADDPYSRRSGYDNSYYNNASGADASYDSYNTRTSEYDRDRDDSYRAGGQTGQKIQYPLSAYGEKYQNSYGEKYPLSAYANKDGYSSRSDQSAYDYSDSQRGNYSNYSYPNDSGSNSYSNGSYGNDQYYDRGGNGGAASGGGGSGYSNNSNSGRKSSSYNSRL